MSEIYRVLKEGTHCYIFTNSLNMEEMLTESRKAKWINDIGGSKTVHQYDNIIGNKTHPCEKPIDLLEKYISNSSNENDIILDPFAGTGSTLISSKKLNRQYIGYEIDKEYFDIAEKQTK